MTEETVNVSRLLSANPKRGQLAKLMRTVALTAADERRARFSDGLDELLREAELEPEDGVVGTFNVLRALSGPDAPSAEGREVMSRLLLQGLAEHERDADGEQWERAATSLCWLAAQSYLSALSFIDEELGADASQLWDELRALVARADSSGAPLGRGSALAAAVALQGSGSDAATGACKVLLQQITDPLLVGALSRPVAESPRISTTASTSSPAGLDATSDVADTQDAAADEPRLSSGPSVALAGEMIPTPLGPFALVLWTVTGLLVVRYIFRFIGNVLLRFRRPVEITATSTGVTIKGQLDVLGRTVRTHQTHIPLDNLARAVREVRYPRLAMYAGLGALAVGTYFGVSLATDGARSGSPSLLGLGAAVFALGVLIDLLFTSLLPGKTGRHQVLFVPRRGRSIAIRTTDAGAADRALRVLASAG